DRQRRKALIVIPCTDNRRLDARGVLHARGLDLRRRYPLSRHLAHVVGAALVGEEAVLRQLIAVAGDRPHAAEGRLRFLVLVPVEGAARIAGDPQIAGVATTELFAVVIHDLRLVARDDRAARPAARLARNVADEAVQHLGRTDPV